MHHQRCTLGSSRSHRLTPVALRPSPGCSIRGSALRTAHSIVVGQPLAAVDSDAKEAVAMMIRGQLAMQRAAQSPERLVPAQLRRPRQPMEEQPHAGNAERHVRGLTRSVFHDRTVDLMKWQATAGPHMLGACQC